MGATGMKEESMTEKINPQDRVIVRTTFRPDQDQEMTALEAEDLRRQDLLVQADQTEPAQPAEKPAQPVRKGEKA